MSGVLTSGLVSCYFCDCGCNWLQVIYGQRKRESKAGPGFEGFAG